MTYEAGSDIRDHQAGRPPARPVVALAGTIGVLALWNVAVRPELPSGSHLPVGLVVAAVVLALGVWGGLGASGLGLEPERIGAGVRWGAAAAGIVFAVVLVGALLPATRELFDVPRAHVSLGALLRDVLLDIPVRTVVVEELAFRGTLFGLLLVLLPRGRAVVVCSLLFGLWHVVPVVGATVGDAWCVALVALGAFIATSVAGAAFCWLRLRSGSVVAPVLAHVATNTLALTLAWVLVR